MVDKHILQTCMAEYRQFALSVKLNQRVNGVIMESNYVFTGCRRSGKTYTMYQIMQRMVREGTPAEQLVYLNFEDERLTGFGVDDLSGILPSYNELYTDTPVLFLDEIQNLPHWEKYVRRLADTGHRVFVTGSNANMLSREISTTLGGRFFIKEIYPLTFSEYLDFEGVPRQAVDQVGPGAVQIQREFREYLNQGGFPEALRFTSSREYLSNIFKKVLYSDILTRHNIRNDRLFELMVKKLAESVGDEISNKRIQNLLSGTGIKLNFKTLADYQAYCEDAYLLFPVRNYLSKFAERETRKKYYFIDNGLLALFYLNGTAQLLENFVYTQLLFAGNSDVWYLRDGHEVDFYVPEKQQAMQVSYSLQHPETRKRELNSLLRLKQKVDITTAFLVTYEEEEVIMLPELEVKVVPAWKWALGVNGG